MAERVTDSAGLSNGDQRPAPLPPQVKAVQKLRRIRLAALVAAILVEMRRKKKQRES